MLFFLSFLLIRYKKDQDIALLATCSLHNLLNASLLSETGPPLLEFEVLNILLFSLCSAIIINAPTVLELQFSELSSEHQSCYLYIL